jgi:hypothetical protein
VDFVEIWLDGPIPVDRDDVEDSLNDNLSGVGEVVGAGTGEFGSNLDVEVEQGASKKFVLDRIFAVLTELRIGDSARVRPGDGDLWIRLGE